MFGGVVAMNIFAPTVRKKSRVHQRHAGFGGGPSRRRNVTPVGSILRCIHVQTEIKGQETFKLRRMAWKIDQ